MFSFLPTFISSEDEGGGGGSYLDGVISSVVFDLDATIAASYDDGVDDQKWFNLIDSPADGAAKSAYHWYLGAGSGSSTDDPTHNGIVGDDAAYWSFDGGDFFSLVTGLNTDFLKDLHKTTGGEDFWIAYAFNKIDVSWSNQSFFATATSNTDGPGIYSRGDGSERIDLWQVDDADTLISSNSAVASPKNGDQLVVLSHSHSTGKTRFWFNTTTVDEKNHVFDTSTGNPDNAAIISGWTGGAAKFNSETRLYHISMGNEYLDDTKAADIIGHIETRHNRDYTP